MIWKLLQQWGFVKMTPPTVTPEREPTNRLGELDNSCLRTADSLSANLYPELKRIAQAKMRHERPDHTLQATALINELYIRLLSRPDFVWKDRNHFLLSASRAMRNLLIDHAREKRSEKRGGGIVRLELSDKAIGIPAEQPEDLLHIDAALGRLGEREPRMARVVELKFYGELTFAEIGDVLSISERTAKRDWTLARAWLKENLDKPDSDERQRMGEDQKPL
jgi:RNA polymerase sigma factor (TIGR02999 family)